LFRASIALRPKVGYAYPKLEAVSTGKFNDIGVTHSTTRRQAE
jgi:hypothetical protein